MRLPVTRLVTCVAAGLIALVRFINAATLATPAPVSKASRICNFQPLVLPNAAKALTSIATTTDGVPFVASEQTVWIRWQSADTDCHRRQTSPSPDKGR